MARREHVAASKYLGYFAMFVIAVVVFLIMG